MSGAIAIFIQQTLNRNEIPFPVQGPNPASITKTELLRRIDDLDHGRNCHLHTDEEMEQMIAKAEKHPKPQKRAKANRRKTDRTAGRRRSA